MHVLLLPMTHAHAQLWLPRFMEASHRRPLIAQEVLGYNADVVCLQEVDEKAFHTYFNPVMQHAGVLASLLLPSSML